MASTSPGSSSNSVNICSLQATSLRTLYSHYRLVPDSLGVSAWQVYLVHGSDELQVVGEGEVEVGHCLGLHALVGVYQQHHTLSVTSLSIDETTTFRTWHPTLASSEGASDLVAEVHVAGGVDHVEEVVLALVGVQHTGRLRLHRDP